MYIALPTSPPSLARSLVRGQREGVMSGTKSRRPKLQKTKELFRPIMSEVTNNQNKISLHPTLCYLPREWTFSKLQRKGGHEGGEDKRRRGGRGGSSVGGSHLHQVPIGTVLLHFRIGRLIIGGMEGARKKTTPHPLLPHRQYRRLHLTTFTS